MDRSRAGQLGLSSKEVIHNVITALTSGAMIAPSFWVDPKTGNDYLLTVQYPRITSEPPGIGAIPIRSPTNPRPSDSRP